MDELHERLTSWFAAQLPDVGKVAIEGLDRVEVGYSAETILLTLVHDAGHQDVVIRARPPAPGLLEPYDLQRQYTILRGLESTPVRAPRALWFEPSGEVLGREFYVMERLPGRVYEQGVPEDVAADPGRIRTMSEGIVDQIAAIHTIDLRATGLDAVAEGRDHLDREIEHWAGEIERVRRGPLPALERLVGALRARQPDACPVVTLVHGDPKPGNFAFEGGEVSAVFDWELATIGDPLADLAWAEVNWTMPGNITSAPGALPVDQLVERWEDLTGITARHRSWYRGFQLLKLSTILLVAGHLFDAGHSDDLRFAQLAHAVHPMTQAGLREVGIDEPLEPGPVLPRKERVLEVKRSAAQ